MQVLLWLRLDLPAQKCSQYHHEEFSYHFSWWNRLFLCGYAIMFGDSVGGIFGTSGFALKGVDDLSFFIFQTMFLCNWSNYFIGAVAERTNIFAYVGVIILMSLVVYPVVGHWVWSGQGWLTDLGFVDFAGSTVVHLTGAVAAFVAAVMVGPRLGKYENGRVNVITGHSIPLGALGVFLLWFGWFGFNGASTLAADPELVPSVIANTFLRAAGVVATAFYTKFRYGHIDGSLTLNGALAGLVGITAGATNVSIFGSLIIGLILCPLLVEGVRFLEWKLKVDDPVGAIAVHGICGIWGTLAVGLFDIGGQGLFYGGGFGLLSIQAIGVIATIAWVSVSVVCRFIDHQSICPITSNS